VKEFKSHQLSYFLDTFRRQEFSGVINVQVESPWISGARRRLLTFHQGWMTYAGVEMPTAPEFVASLGHEFKVQVMESALKLANKKVQDPRLIREYLELFVRLNLFQWQDIEALMRTKIIGILEQLIPYSGTISEESDAALNLHYSAAQPGFSWANLQPIYAKRQQQWTALAPVIPTIEAVPHVLDFSQADSSVVQHLNQWVDGQRSLADIATATEQDPLQLAHLYYKWAKERWLTCNEAELVDLKSSVVSERPIILSVDDSPVVQTLIERAISDRYQVLLADNAVDALNILNSQKVALMLLDVTMPDIDGLDLCRVIRSIGKFRDLPIVMLTAKDGVFNKLKGQMAGSTHYLTKPATREKLLEVLEKYIPVELQV
jgi:CheY-like chemotaxis protein